MKIDVLDERVIQLLQACGIPYSWGAGTPRDGAGPWPPVTLPVGINGGRGFDCSGFVQAALVHLGRLAPTAGDRTAAALFLAGTEIPQDQAQLGDLAFYGTPHVNHVMLCIGFEFTLGAVGGGSHTNGDAPHEACVQPRPMRYRKDFRGVRRI